MKKFLKWLGISTGSVAGLALLAVGAVYALSARAMTGLYDVTPVQLAIPDDSASIAHGRHWVRSIAKCMDCHGGDYGGKVFLDDPLLGRIAAPNITAGGVTANYTDADWIRTIRHGIRPDGRSLLVMPAFEFYRIGDRDLAAMVAFLKTLPAVRNDSLPSLRLGPMGRFLIVSGAFPVLAATAVDHDAPHPGAPEAGATPEYGRYVASVGCVGCHGEAFEGGKPPAPPAPALDATGDVATWTEDDFRLALRAGKRPDGTVLSTDMPWNLTTEMTDMEISAVWSYIQSLSDGPGTQAAR